MYDHVRRIHMVSPGGQWFSSYLPFSWARIKERQEIGQDPGDWQKCPGKDAKCESVENNWEFHLQFLLHFASRGNVDQFIYCTSEPIIPQNLISFSTYSLETPYILSLPHTYNPPPPPPSIWYSNTASTRIIQIYSELPKVKFKWNIAVWVAPQNMICLEWIPHLMHISGLLCCTTSMYERQVSRRGKLIQLSVRRGPSLI